MAEVTEAEKRNSPHIRRVSDFAEQILAVKALVTEDAKFNKVSEQAKLLANQLRALFNNREIALVCTKLDEVSIWTAEKDIEQIRTKLTEARGWCLNYIELLKAD